MAGKNGVRVDSVSQVSPLDSVLTTTPRSPTAKPIVLHAQERHDCVPLQPTWWRRAQAAVAALWVHAPPPCSAAVQGCRGGAPYSRSPLGLRAITDPAPGTAAGDVGAACPSGEGMNRDPLLSGGALPGSCQRTLSVYSHIALS